MFFASISCGELLCSTSCLSGFVCGSSFINILNLLMNTHTLSCGLRHKELLRVTEKGLRFLVLFLSIIKTNTIAMCNKRIECVRASPYTIPRSVPRIEACNASPSLIQTSLEWCLLIPNFLLRFLVKYHHSVEHCSFYNRKNGC
jgi:hypothetical protein